MNCLNIISKFDIQEDVLSVTPYGNGHINSTFLVTTRSKKYILQRLNTYVFKNPEQVMSNIAKVTAHLGTKGSDKRKVMSIVPCKNGEFLYSEGDKAWRMLSFVEDSICLEAPEGLADIYECAFAFGNFQKLLADFDASELYETIPDFHNTQKRYADFLNAVKEDPMGRAKNVQNEIDFINSRADFYSVLTDAFKKGLLPLRVAHNDTKINNVLLDKVTRKALCVIDLDTVMPGFSVTDFGDAIRTCACTAAEDEKDLSKVTLDIELYKAFANGFVAGCDGILKNEEIMLFPEGAKMMAIEVGIRFLTDYLLGDTYFKTEYDTHNLDRCRTQLKLVSETERLWSEMKKCLC